MAIVKLNNDLRELAIKEQEEIEIILATLSEIAGEHMDQLEYDYNTITELDFIFIEPTYPS